MRVTVLTHYYRPEVGAPQARLATLAGMLAARGVEVTVHTGFPNYPDGRIRAPYRNRPWLEERDGDVRVVRSLVHPTPNRGVGRRLANHAVFAASAVLTSGRSGPADVVLAETPPLFIAAAAVPYARRTGARLVLNVSDRWPASAVELGALTNPRAIAAAEALERWCYRHAAAVAVPTAGLLADLGRTESAAGKVHRLGPAVDTARFVAAPPRTADAGAPPRTAGAGAPLRVLYAGTIGMAQGIGCLVEAARIAGPETVEVWIAGDGAEAPSLRAELARTPASNVRLLGTVAYDDVPALYDEVDVAAVLLRDRPIFRGALPTKLLEAMAKARPVVVSAHGEAADLVEAAQAGLAVPPEDPRALAAAIAELAANRDRLGPMGTAGRACAEAHAWPAVADRWYALLSAVATGDAPYATASSPDGTTPNSTSSYSPM